MYLPEGAMKRPFYLYLAFESRVAGPESPARLGDVSSSVRCSLLVACPLWFVMDTFTRCL
jgi:hypothetical protein